MIETLDIIMITLSCFAMIMFIIAVIINLCFLYRKNLKLREMEREYKKILEEDDK